MDKTMEIRFSNLFRRYFQNISMLWKSSNFSSVFQRFTLDRVEFVRIRINLNVQGISLKNHVTGKRQNMEEPSALQDLVATTWLLVLNCFTAYVVFKTCDKECMNAFVDGCLFLDLTARTTTEQ